MAKATVAASATPTLLNRELSWLDFNERVLALAADETVPLLERVKFCSIFASNLDEFFMVRVAGLMDQAASGLPVRSHDGLTPREALTAIRERVDELTRAAVAPLAEGDRARRSPRRASISACVDDCRGRRGGRARPALPARDLPGADAARRRAGPAVPVHLGALAQPRRARARSRQRRGALRAREGARAASALRRRRRGPAAAAARGRDRPLPRLALPRAWRSWSAPRSGSRATPTWSSPTTRTTCSRRCGPRSAGGASATSCGVEVASSMSAAMVEQLRAGLRRDATTEIYAIARHARPVRGDADRGARPARS